MSIWLWLTSTRGEYEREMHARDAEKCGDHETAANYRACMCASEWQALGYEGSFGNYKKIRETGLTARDVIHQTDKYWAQEGKPNYVPAEYVLSPQDLGQKD